MKTELNLPDILDDIPIVIPKFASGVSREINNNEVCLILYL